MKKKLKLRKDKIKFCGLISFKAQKYSFYPPIVLFHYRIETS
jgi:hypothetical protein